MSQPKTVHVQYFAALREQRGCSGETLQTGALTARSLYDELQRRYGLQLDAKHLKVAINEAFQPWDTPLANADTVVFIPPVAGG